MDAGMTIAAAAIAAACIVGSAVAWAQPLADPTRPPNVAAEGDGGVATVSGPRLESVLIAPNRRIAVISGQAVKVGDKYGEGQVVRITESEVVLRSGETTETLKLFPAVDKKARARREQRTKP
jgi:MSHA biogenesis protein MshK